MAAGILNAAGNSKRSLLYLGAASITNIVLDLVLIAGCKMGVAGAAIATDISQLVSCVLSLRFLMRVEEAAAYYANSLASYIANSQPRIKAVFDSWHMQGGKKENFLSQLQKNQEVKNILLEESPWLLEATTEAEQQARIATLFDLNNLSNNNMTTLIKLQELQNADGAWSWYKGMPGSHIIVRQIIEIEQSSNTRLLFGFSSSFQQPRAFFEKDILHLLVLL